MAAQSRDRWVVCAGAVEFQSIAGALAMAAGASSLRWETDALMARELVEYGPSDAQTHVVVGQGLQGGDPFSVACDLAAMGRGRTVLCLPDAARRCGEAAARGVTATVDPAGLTRLLCAMRTEELAASLKAAGQPPSRLDGRQVRGTGVLPAGESGAKAPGGGFDLEAVKEPLVLAPVVNLSQNIECRVAGMDAPVPTICLASARGGVGKSALAVTAALALARAGLSVSLIDLDFQFGTCLGYLGSAETDGLIDADCVPRDVTVDARTLARCRTTPESRLAAYEFCRLPEQAELLGGVAAELVKAARAGCDVAVVDLPSGVNETVAQALELADRCLFVADQGALSLESVSAQQALCGRLGIPRTKLVTVMNRCDPRHRDEGFLSRAGFETQTPQVVRVLDGGAEVTQMLSIGRAGELLNIQNKFATSVTAMLAGICTDLGIAGFETPSPTPSAKAALDKAARIGRRKGAVKEGEATVCPF